MRSPKSDDSKGNGRFLLNLYRKALTLFGSDLYEYFLDHAVNLTKSEIGFFHFVGEDQKNIRLTTWNKEALKNCTANYAAHYPLEQAGNWADSIREKRPVVYNDFQNSPNQKGLPKGHVPIKRILVVPVLEDNKVLAIFGVGNKQTLYDEEDVVQLDVLASELGRIIKQRFAENELLVSQERYRSLFNNMLDGFIYCQVIFDESQNPQDFVWLEVNETFEKITGIEKSRLLDKRATDIFPGLKQANPEFLGRLGRIAITGVEEKFEVFFRPLGIWLSVSAYSPKTGYFAAVIENITQRKKAEEALREGENRLKRSQEMAHVGSWELDLKENRLVWSDEVYRIFGLKPQEFGATYDAFLSYVHPDDRMAVNKAYTDSVEQGKDSYQIEHRVVRKNTDEVRIVHEKCTHIRDGSGQITRSIGMVQDITEFKKIEQALRESEERLQLKLDSLLSPDAEVSEEDLANIIDVPSLQVTMDYLYSVTRMAFALIDLKGKVLVGTGWQDICTKFHRINPQTCQNCIESDIELSSGVSKGDIRIYKCKNHLWDVAAPIYIGDKHVGNVFFGQFFFDDEAPDRQLFEAQAERYGFDKQAYMEAFDRIPRFSRKNIEALMVFYARLSEMLSKTSHSNLKLAKAFNTQKELQLKLEDKAAEVEEYASQMEQLAEERARQLKDAERLSAIGATAGMVGHDIRNPLQAIVSELYLAKSEVESLSTDLEAKANLQENIRSIEDNVFYMNKIVADLQDYARPLNPKMEQIQVASAITGSLAMVNIPTNVKVTVTSPEKLPAITADSTMLKRVLVNLIQNAVQAMPKGGDLTICSIYSEHELKITIQDSGEGIPKEVQPKLFTPLMTTKSKGQGFGLAVVKRMTEAMGGTVTFESEVGVGTKFILKFRVK